MVSSRGRASGTGKVLFPPTPPILPCHEPPNPPCQGGFFNNPSSVAIDSQGGSKFQSADNPVAILHQSANARSSLAFDPQGGSKFQSAHLPAIAVVGFSSGWGTIPSSSGGIDPRANESVLIDKRRGENETGDSASCGANVYSSVGALFFISGKRSSCFLGRVRLPRSRRASPLSSVGANSPSSCKFDS